MNPITIIHNEYAKFSQNPNSSLREFARHLEIDASTLSKILSGKRGIPKSHATKIASKLLRSTSERAEFVEAVLSFKGADEKREIIKPLKLDQNTSSDNFFIIAEWEYFAILNILTIKNFNNTPQFIAQSLNLSMKRVSQCLSVLQRNGFVSIKNGVIKREVKAIHTTNDELSRALKLAHLEELDLAREKIEVDLDKRYYQSNMLTIAIKDLKKIKKLIDKMNDEAEVVADHSTSEEVYMLTCQLFPLSNCKIVEKSFKDKKYVH